MKKEKEERWKEERLGIYILEEGQEVIQGYVQAKGAAVVTCDGDTSDCDGGRKRNTTQ